MSARIVNNITVNLMKDNCIRSRSIHSEQEKETKPAKTKPRGLTPLSSNNSQILHRKKKASLGGEKFGVYSKLDTQSQYNLRGPSPVSNKKFLPNVVPTRRLLQMFRNSRQS